MTLIALDLNATRARALQGLSPREGRPVHLEGTEADLPLAVSVEGRQPQPGRAGVALCRRSPHLACVNFLPHLGDRREWSGSRCKVDACRALSAILDQVAARVGRHTAAALVLPGYLLPEQRALVEKAAELSRLRLFGSLDTGLAAALTAHAQQPWDGLALVLDVDEHAASWTAVWAGEGSGRIVQHEFHPTLGERAWKERLLTAVADACVRRSRRDPRDSAEAEQTLYDQLDPLLLSCLDQRAGEVAVRTPTWSQTLVLGAAELTTACQTLLERCVRAFHACYDSALPYAPLRTVLVTAAAARLPGLVPALERELAGFGTEGPAAEDPGEDLIDAVPLHVRVLAADAPAQAAHALAALFQHQTLPPGHLDAAPLLEAQSPALGVARLHFRGREHLMRAPLFLLGRDPRCDLVFDTLEYPSISGQHCKIVFERQGFTLHDLSRHGTSVNDRPVIQQRELQPGDWIRLGPGGPLLRFLGHTIDARKLMPTTA